MRAKVAAIDFYSRPVNSSGVTQFSLSNFALRNRNNVFLLVVNVRQTNIISVSFRKNPMKCGKGRR